MFRSFIIPILLSFIFILGIKIYQFAAIINNYDLFTLDLAERSHYIGCRRVSENHSYCKELSRQWRKELSLKIGLTDNKGTCIED
jgi:hypothetical protein